LNLDLYGGAGASSGVSISQTGVVPASAESILFKAQNAGALLSGILSVSVGGQNIPFSALFTGSNYTLYGGDVSAFSGQSKQLVFSALAGDNNYWEIDDIQFSQTAIPEPSEFVLAALGALLFGFQRWLPKKLFRGFFRRHTSIVR
jgi:hypothetical protein